MSGYSRWHFVGDATRIALEQDIPVPEACRVLVERHRTILNTNAFTRHYYGKEGKSADWYEALTPRGKTRLHNEITEKVSAHRRMLSQWREVSKP